ncbi:MAG: leucyl/phenylalanyl-tRNA--protein transferase [Gammaproteobacteria bacterium]
MITNTKLYWIADNIVSEEFPDVSHALTEPDGLLAIGGDLNPDRLLDAYRKGIFPWYSEGQPIMWWSPDPRCVLFPDELIISRSLKKSLRKHDYKVTFDQVFSDVVKSCAGPRLNSPGTWITQAIIKNYQLLHESGHAHSVECWLQGELVGGLYGIAIGQIFFGESMFSRITDASKICLVHLVHFLKIQGFALIDCQVYSEHLARLGARVIPRDEFSNALDQFSESINKQLWPQKSVYKTL